jgi:hypothetical protein
MSGPLRGLCLAFQVDSCSAQLIHEAAGQAEAPICWAEEVRAGEGKAEAEE